jgi:hypothetical protein
MAEFYHNLITDASFKLLQDIKRKFDFVLIGGWAVFLYTKALKSKDIDIIVDFDQLDKIKQEFEVFKNERLKRYEAKTGETDIDIYLPHFSNIGIPIEDIMKHTQAIEGFSVPVPEILLVLKVYCFSSRKGSVKGNKDLIDIFSLLSKGIIDWQKYKKIITEYNFENINQELKDLVFSQKSIPELNLLNHKIAKLKNTILKELGAL